MSLYSLKVLVSVFVVFVFVVSHRNNLQFARGDTANPQLVVSILSVLYLLYVSVYNLS